ncbi:cyclic nucleotide-binding domain-containing protein [Candidatus Chloroploca sp. Khr17]|uniref:cyclic nucleotide-binding domain-containing protein n=1 Tax=Candidatus Chloroploca sp. Khr17 TaxID=2496869 RepID=UPI00101B794C|nr:cyclic nucleotide-binding domain-containing protein [Candidatus Chloroploca sp. Khr17]
MAAKKPSPARSPVAQARADRESMRRKEALAVLACLDCFQDVPPGELNRLLAMSTFRAFPAGATLLGQQKQDRFLFIILQGSLFLRLRDKDSRDVLMGALSRGDCFGEGPLFGDFFRRMSALTQTDCHLLQIPMAELRDAMSSMPMLAAALRRVYKQRMVDCTLARVPLLSQLFPMERLALAGLLEPMHVARGNLIICQGEPASALYLLENGQVIVEQDGVTIATLGEGDFFGEMSLLTSKPHRANVRALTPTDVLALPGAEFYRLIEERPELEAQLRQVIEARLSNSEKVSNDEERKHQVELAVTKGLLRGTHLLVRTPELCPPECRICEQACADRHGRARLSLNGAMIDQFDVVDTCRQCSVGAECVEVCPDDAFERTENGVLIITDACTGCGKCLEACPYDAVASVPLPHQRPQRGPLVTMLRAASDRLRRSPMIPLEPARPTHRADKCDLCHGYNDLTCVSRCPTGSLRLVPVEEVFPL